MPSTISKTKTNIRKIRSCCHNADKVDSQKSCYLLGDILVVPVIFRCQYTLTCCMWLHKSKVPHILTNRLHSFPSLELLAPLRLKCLQSSKYWSIAFFKLNCSSIRHPSNQIILPVSKTATMVITDIIIQRGTICCGNK